MKHTNPGRQDTAPAVAETERRHFLGWMAAGAMTIAVPGLTSCGGGSIGDGSMEGSGSGKDTVTSADRMSVIATVETELRNLDGEGLSPLDLMKGLAAFMATLPAYVSTGVDEETLCAWGIFSDGRLHVVANNRNPVEPPAMRMRAGDMVAGTLASPAMLAAAMPVELPAARHARIMHAFGPDFPQVQNIVNDLQAWMALSGYTVRGGAEGDARVSTLRAISGDGFLYINAHGGAHPYDRNDSVDPATEKKLFSVQSSTPVSDVLDNMPDFRDDLDNLRLTYFTAATGSITKNWRGKEVPARDTRYGITANFVSRYWNFSRHSTVFINACFSANPNRSSAINFIAACHDKGAGVYLGWTHVVSGHGSSHAPRYFVDRMLGGNQYQPESPDQRAFAWDKVMEDMRRNGHDQDAPKTDGGATAVLVARKNPAEAKLHSLAPGIHHMEVSEWDDRLTLIGDFGSTRGQVLINGFNSGIISWDADRIVCNLPGIGMDGSCGPVFVRVGDLISNTRQLTQWTTSLSVVNTVNAKPGLRLQGATTVYHRADIGKTRDNPGETPKKPVRHVIAARDSVLALTARGSYSEPLCTTTWSGADVRYPAIPDLPVIRVLYAYFKIDTNTGKGALGLALGAASGQSGFQTTTCDGGSVPMAPQGFGLLENFVGFVPTEGTGTNTQMLPALNITLNSDFSIADRTFTDADGEVTVMVTGSRVFFPPLDTEGI